MVEVVGGCQAQQQLGSHVLAVQYGAVEGGVAAGRVTGPRVGALRSGDGGAEVRVLAS